jgi:hypothetical protein
VQVSRREAQVELARRAARESMAAWMVYRRAPYKPALHHKLLIAELEKVELGVTKNLMFNLPPGSAKSTYSSVEFPAWYMGRNPKSLMLACSNTDRLAQVFSRRARNIVDSPSFQDVFGFGLAADKRGIENWENTEGGEYLSAGVGAAIAGRRADIGLIDDPVKSREDADSERSRDSVWEWYVNDFLTRLKPDSRQILIMTRWHEDDLGGRILERDRKHWKVVSIPMEAQEDDLSGENLESVCGVNTSRMRCWKGLNRIGDRGLLFISKVLPVMRVTTSKRSGSTSTVILRRT